MESSHSSLEVLPIPCLCEFLMASYKDQGGATTTEMETDPSSHRAHYKRRKTAHEKVSERESMVSLLRACTSLPVYSHVGS